MASSTGRYASPAPRYSMHCPRAIHGASEPVRLARNVSTTVVLPMPASPVTNAIWRSPRRARANHAWMRATSASRATTAPRGISAASPSGVIPPTKRKPRRFTVSIGRGSRASSFRTCRISRIQTVSTASPTVTSGQTAVRRSSLDTRRPARETREARTPNALGVSRNAWSPRQRRAFRVSGGRDRTGRRRLSRARSLDFSQRSLDARPGQSRSRAGTPTRRGDRVVALRHRDHGPARSTRALRRSPRRPSSGATARARRSTPRLVPDLAVPGARRWRGRARRARGREASRAPPPPAGAGRRAARARAPARRSPGCGRGRIRARPSPVSGRGDARAPPRRRWPRLPELGGVLEQAELDLAADDRRDLGQSTAPIAQAMEPRG